jgi:adenine-specific DNA-methyltransferase
MAKKKPADNGDAKKPGRTSKAKGSAGNPTALDSITHVGDTRRNIPTRELAGFADDGALKKVLYPRDPSLDPQLVWRGKDEQDAHPLEVPAVPIYVQEKIHPRALIEDIRARAEAGRPKAVDLFSDFNGLDDFAKKLEFYQHDQHWTNRLILGDSLLVMTSLAEKERLKGKVQCVYIDPPYGIKFGSNWQVSTRKRDVKDAKAEDLTRQPEQIKAFRDTWELGIHSYLSTWRDRLIVARDLLAESGSIFVQIGDENVHLVRSLLDEVFGSENSISQVTFLKTTGAGSYAGGTNTLAATGDYLLWYAKNVEVVKYRQVWAAAARDESSTYRWLKLVDGTLRGMTAAELRGDAPIPNGARLYQPSDLTSQTTRTGQTTVFPVQIGGKSFMPGKGGWKTNKDGMNKLLSAGRIHVASNSIRYIRHADDFPFRAINNIWTDTGTGNFTDEKVYVVQTSLKVIERCLLMTTDPGDLVLDPTCGSGTTAYAAEQWGRRWIAIDTSRVALALARTRLMAARFPYYLLADSPEGRKKQIELTGQLFPPDALPTQRDVRKGFVYMTVSHVTLKSIANNPDIQDGMTREEIDRAIQRHADTETLYDRPYEDKGVVRLTGPFTVESLSPHRNLPDPEADHPASVPAAEAQASGPNYVQLILDNLRKAGVKGLDKRDRIEFERLDPFPSSYVQAEGVTTAGAAVRVSVGPEFGTVGDEWIKAAALQAIKGSRCDLLLVCAFAFEAGVLEQTAELKKEIQFGKMRVLPVRMNPDLAMGDVLKKTGAGHLFTVFGEPDIELTIGKNKQVTVTIRGLDVFDPTTGEVRSGTTDDIACWFIDTAYDGQSFFVRQAYFCGADDPYEKLKRALKAEIDEAEWAKLYSTTSVPFDPPATGRIAVKVINHFGDEVLQVYDVR